jgi:hypothetical protein
MASQLESSVERDKILQRILNLRVKAEDSGASESEMNAAFTMAMKLMNSYNVAEAELALAEAQGRIVLEVINKEADTTVLKGKSHLHKVLFVLTGIEQFTETKAVYSRYSGVVTFTGHRPDVELANFLLAVIKEALDREYDNYRRSNPALGYGAKTSFQNAMSYRVNSRLKTMAMDREIDRREAVKHAKAKMIENSATSSSTAMIVLDIAEQKAKEVKDAFAKAYPRLRRVQSFSRSSNNNAFSAGKAAGDRVNLGKVINQGSVKSLT